MQASFIDVDSIDSIDTASTAYHSHELRNYIKERFSRTMQSVKEYGGKALDGFLERSKRVYEKYNGEEALAKTRAAIRSMKGMRNNNIIRYMDGLEDLRSTGICMQRYLMADPVIRRIFVLQRCDGYSASYKDVHPGDIGKSHYDYRRATNSIFIKTTDEQGNEVYEHTQWFENLIEGDRELDFEEKVIIQDAWQLQRMFAHAMTDSTDQEL